MEWTESATYRRGKLLKDKNRAWLRRMRVDRKTGREISGIDWLTHKPDPIYRHRQRTHYTSYVLVSASDLKIFMEASRQRMVKIMQEKGDKEGEALFRHSYPFEVETYIFPCDKFGNWKNGGELEGSQRGTLDHRVALRDAGYTVIGMPYQLVLMGASVDKIEVDTGSGFQPTTTGEVNQ
jgi:hypothetical protein